MNAGFNVPEQELYTIYDDLSDGILILGPTGKELYRNKAMKRLPEHLENRLMGFISTKECVCEKGPHERLVSRSQMEGWNFNCYSFGAGKLVLVKFDDQLGKQIKALRSQFADAIRDGMPAASAAMQVLRNHVSSRWIAIGSLDTINHGVVFDLAYDGDHLQANRLPAFKCHGHTRPCEHDPLITSDFDPYFCNSQELKAFGIGHVIGMSMNNHRNECVGYALLADEEEPRHMSHRVTLLKELAVLFGPYFEVSSAHQKVSRAVAAANTDVVTGHGNRRALESFLEDCLKEMTREQQDGDVLTLFDSRAMRNSVVMLVDMDGFKRVNDLMGHAEGDRALRLVADSLKQIDRNSRVFRFGGDELVQVFPRAGELDADELRQHVNGVEKKLAAEGFTDLGLSFGIVHLFEGDGSYGSLMTLADARMYHEKRQRSVAFV
nr:GGDEF domain-containing protein [uncultured Cohaesibacter sp.]